MPHLLGDQQGILNGLVSPEPGSSLFSICSIPVKKFLRNFFLIIFSSSPNFLKIWRIFLCIIEIWHGINSQDYSSL